MFSIFFTRLVSDLLTSALSTSFRTRLRGFFVRMWRAWLCRRMIFPVPVTLNRLCSTSGCLLLHRYLSQLMNKHHRLRLHVCISARRTASAGYLMLFRNENSYQGISFHFRRPFDFGNFLQFLDQPVPSACAPIPGASFLCHEKQWSPWPCSLPPGTAGC